MLASSIVNSVMFKNIPASVTYPNNENTLHKDLKHGQCRIIPYYQKFPKDHPLKLQFMSDVPDTLLIEYMIGNAVVNDDSAEYSTHYGTTNNRYYFNYSMILGSWIYDKKFWIRVTQGTDVLTSEPIECKDISKELSSGLLKYIQYSNLDRIESDLDNRLVDWYALDDGFMDMFIEAIDAAPNDNDSIEILEGSQSKTVLSASYFTGKELQTGPMPDYMMTKIGAISNLDVFMINEIQYIKTDSFDISRFGNSTSYQGSMKLTQKYAIGINVDNIGISGEGIPSIPTGTLMYIGSVVNSSPSESEVKATTGIPAVKEDKTKSYTISNQCPFIAYPTSFGSLTSIIDNTGFEIISGFNITTIDFTFGSDTVNMTIYAIKLPVYLTSFNITYKF